MAYTFWITTRIFCGIPIFLIGGHKIFYGTMSYTFIKLTKTKWVSLFFTFCFVVICWRHNILSKQDFPAVSLTSFLLSYSLFFFFCITLLSTLPIEFLTLIPLKLLQDFLSTYVYIGHMYAEFHSCGIFSPGNILLNTCVRKIITFCPIF